jgi:putative oxidoreductase
MAYGLLALRVVIGLTLAAHGAQKLFGWFGGGGLRATADFFGDNLGFRMPLAMALAAAVSEFGGGLLFAAGLVTPAASTGIAAVMVVAIATVHWKNGFWAGKGGYEFNLALITVAVAVAATGPGRFSLDRALGWDDNLAGIWWGVGALGVAAVGALAMIGLFRAAPRESPAAA